MNHALGQAQRHQPPATRHPGASALFSSDRSGGLIVVAPRRTVKPPPVPSGYSGRFGAGSPPAAPAHRKGMSSLCRGHGLKTRRSGTKPSSKNVRMDLSSSSTTQLSFAFIVWGGPVAPIGDSARPSPARLRPSESVSDSRRGRSRRAARPPGDHRQTRRELPGELSRCRDPPDTAPEPRIRVADQTQRTLRRLHGARRRQLPCE